WLVLVLLLLLRRDWKRWMARLLGWLLLVPVAALVAHRRGRPLPARPGSGNGGSRGGWADPRLAENLDPPWPTPGPAGPPGLDLLRDVPRQPDEPELEERVGRSVSNGLHSERQRFAGFELPPVNLLEDPRPSALAEYDQQLRERGTLLEKTFRDFGLNVKVVG